MRLQPITCQFEYWMKYDKAIRDAEGLETPDETVIYQLPHHLSYGQLKAWVKRMNEVDAILEQLDLEATLKDMEKDNEL